MAMAKTFERQGHFAQAKSAYLQILASQPDYPDAQQSLETLIANQANPQQQRKKSTNSIDQAEQLAAKSKAAERRAKELADLKEHAEKLAQAESYKPLRKRSENRDQLKQVKADERTTPRSNTVVASQESEDAPISRELRNSRTDAIEPAPSRFTRSGRNSSVGADDTEKLVDYAAAPKASRAIGLSEVARQDLDLRSEPYEQVGRDEVTRHEPEDLTDSPTLSTHVSSTARDSVTTDSSAQLDFADALAPDASSSEESLKFEKPIVRRPRVLDATLEPFFGPFHTGLVQDLIANREQFQKRLAELVSDKDADDEVRSRAVFLLGSIGPAAVDALPALRQEMHYDVDDFLRVDLSEAILKIRPEDEDAIQVLVDSLEDSNENVRWVAAFALRSAVSPRTTFVIDSLCDALKTEDLKLKRMIFLTLAEFGPAAEKVIPVLEAALESPDAATREVAKAALDCIAPDRKTTPDIEKVSHTDELPLSN